MPVPNERDEEIPGGDLESDALNIDAIFEDARLELAEEERQAAIQSLLDDGGQFDPVAGVYRDASGTPRLDVSGAPLPGA